MLRIDKPIDLSLILKAGQVFCWEFCLETDEWIGVIDSSIFRLKQAGPGISFTFESSALTDEQATARLFDFFQLNDDLLPLRSKWSQHHGVFISEVFEGLRVCRQDPYECLISFLVSANNNIKRINQNLRSIRKTFGTCLNEAQGLYAFPSVAQLSTATSEQLRGLGLGYRAEYMVKTVNMLAQEGVMDQLYQLRKEVDTEAARDFLTQFQGVGRKVADCVMLYALDFPEITPVDTHMFQIAQRIFSRNIKKDNAMHDTIQTLMIERFGPKAGWAHCYLFAADLRPAEPPVKAKKSKRAAEDEASTATSSPV
jgi:N-glycosylase/DNA lyase